MGGCPRSSRHDPYYSLTWDQTHLATQQFLLHPSHLPGGERGGREEGGLGSRDGEREGGRCWRGMPSAWRATWHSLLWWCQTFLLACRYSVASWFTLYTRLTVTLQHCSSSSSSKPDSTYSHQSKILESRHSVIMALCLFISAIRLLICFYL